MKNNVSKNIFLNLIYRAVNLIAPLVTSPYLARTLGATSIGTYSYLNSIAFYFFSFAMLGVNTYGCREIAKVQDDERRISSTFWQIFYMQFFASIFLSVLYLVVAFFLKSSCGITAFLMVLYVSSAAVDIDWFAFGLEKFKITTIARSTTKALSIVLILLYVHNESDLWIYAIIMQFCNIFNFAFIWPIVLKKTCFQKPCKKEMWIHFKPNLVLFLPVIASSAYLYIDKIMIGEFATKGDVGYYNYAENIYSILCSINIAASSVLLSRSSKLLAQKEDNLESVYHTVEYIAMIDIAIMFGTLAVSDLFIPWFLGEGFVKTSELLKILCPCVLITGFTEIIKNQVLIPRGMDKAFLISIFVGAGTNVITNIFMIPVLGATGAAITTVVAYSITMLVQIILSRNLISYKKIMFMLIPFLIFGACMFMLLYIIGDISSHVIINLIAKIIIGGMFYVLVSGFYLLFKRRIHVKCNI